MRVYVGIWIIFLRPSAVYATRVLDVSTVDLFITQTRRIGKCYWWFTRILVVPTSRRRRELPTQYEIDRKIYRTCSNKKNVVGFAVNGFYLRVNCDHREPVTVKQKKNINFITLMKIFLGSVVYYKSVFTFQRTN